jgi:hypothetical protein
MRIATPKSFPPILALVALAALATPAAAIAPIGGAQFEALSAGRTLYFSQAGRPYGAEEYYGDRRARWMAEDGSCTEGYWYEAKGPLICFVYEDQPEPVCWHFEKRDGRFFARIAGIERGDASELLLESSDDRPLGCPGPDTGV